MRCPALCYTNRPEQLVIQCNLEAGHKGNHVEHPSYYGKKQ